MYLLLAPVRQNAQGTLDFAEHTCWIAGDKAVRRHRSGHHGSGTDNNIVAYRHAGEYHGVAADPNIVADSDGECPLNQFVARGGVERMTRSINAHIGADKGVVADSYAVFRRG